MEVKAAQLINLGISPSTAKVYDASKKAYLKFCARFNFTPIPAQEEVLILFVTELSQTLVYNSVRTYLVGVRHLHVVSGAGNPLQEKLRLQLALAGIRRWKPKAGGTRLPKTPLVLRAIKKVLDAASTDYQNILLWAASGSCDRVNFTTSTTAFNPSCHLSIQDVAIDSHSNPTLVQLHLKQSKTDQFRQGAFIYLSRTGTDLCPVSALLAYLAIRGDAPGPLFIHQDKSPLTKQNLILMLRSTLQEAGIDATYYSGHSFRIGTTTTAAACGISETIIMQMGRWRSSAYQAYIKIPTRDLATILHKIAS